MNITMIADKEGTAIHRLCEYTKKALPQHKFKIVCVHPKRPSREQIEAVEQALEWCDVVDFRYWKSAELVKSLFSVRKPAILTHYNPYDIAGKSWVDYGINIVVNAEQSEMMRGQSYYIGLPVDITFWKYNPEFDEERKNTVIMVANRIEAKKGILPVAQATKELGMKLILVGRPSDPNYLEMVLAHDNVEYHEGVSDDALLEFYNQSGIHVCNSVDNFESGTMPILEAMSCGVPILTRKVGHVPELFDGRNMVVRKGLPDNVTELKAKLESMRSDTKWLQTMRADAWQTVKNRNLFIYGLKYSKLYWKSLCQKPLVSVIVPTYNRINTLTKTLAQIIAQKWEPFEVIVCDDGSFDGTRQLVENIQKSEALPKGVTIKYFNTVRFQPDITNDLGISKIYGLGHARNIGMLNAEGEHLLFVDDRLSIDENTIAAFMERAGEKIWQWGEKDGTGKGFVENFSFVSRQTLVNLGGFSELISQYGGMTQEVRKRAEASGITFSYCHDAKAKAISKSSSKWSKFLDIAKSKSQCYALGYE